MPECQTDSIVAMVWLISAKTVGRDDKAKFIGLHIMDAPKGRTAR